ncbi:MAG: ABC transporter [Bacteroidetes bacterium HGW-Bacteroidetes-1]|jgi:ABC-type lipoprotein export system ATPase subunit|nr:MAG: ABC transporter [Bacteroidetes bacterium HGW-Bacteroidetes-1]
MVSRDYLLKNTPAGLLKEFPFLSSFFAGQTFGFELKAEESLQQIIQEMDEAGAEDNAFDAENFLTQLHDFITQMNAFLGHDKDIVESLTIIAGKDKSGHPEQFGHLVFNKSTITSIVGPTGSGKSRLLADIEWVAQADTPTGRSILVNGEKPLTDWRFASGKKLVAQLSQNMNFVMDLTVSEFLDLHAKSRMIVNPEHVVEKIIDAANDLAGEKFRGDTPITSLSGGQSRALMIADTAMLSSSPVVLIDEIENAGIDRKKALQILIGQEKIVLMATHDPILALMADQRIVIKNGGIHRVIKTTAIEKVMLEKLEKADKKLQKLRTALRSGEIIDENIYQD